MQIFTILQSMYIIIAAFVQINTKILKIHPFGLLLLKLSILIFTC